MQIVRRVFTWAFTLVIVVFLLMMVEGSIGHDGLLCELEIVTGPTSNGCGL